MDTLKQVTDIMDPLSPYEQAAVIDDLMTKYGVPRAFVVDLLEMMGLSAMKANEMIDDRSPMMLRKED